MSYRTITVFSDGDDSGQRLTPLLASMLIHGLGAGILSFAVMYTPRIISVTHTDRYSMRRLELQMPEPSRGHPMHDPGQNRTYSGADARSAASERIAAYLGSMRLLADARRGPQTLLQPDISSQPEFHDKLQVPSFVLWTPSKTRVSTIVAPLPEKPANVDVIPSISAPNEELALRDMALTATETVNREKQPLPGTTSPLLAHHPDAAAKVPITVTQTADKPAPAAILSLSDLRTEKGTAFLPPVNEIAGSQTPAETGPPTKSIPTNNERLGRASGDNRTVQDSKSIKPAAQEHQGTIAAAGETSSLSLNGEVQPSATEISLPKEGRFAAVVAGTSLQERFPDIEDPWSSRLSYTVYLNVGLSQSWILQYSLPRAAEASAGGRAHLEAPWPYTIVRPNLTQGSVDADALIVNAVIDQNGRFVAAQVIFPEAFPQAEFVLACLRRWQFRPAAQDGHPTEVEVMLVIPEAQ